MRKHGLKYTTIYMEGKYFYIRLTPLETERFRHGLSLGFKTEDEEDIIMTAHSVEKYLDEWLDMEFENRNKK